MSSIIHRHFLGLLLGLFSGFFFASPAYANTPFTVVRTADGKLDHIELPELKARPGDADVLTQLRAAVKAREKGFSLDDKLSDEGLDKQEEKDAFADAKQIAYGVTTQDLADPRLDQEFAKAKIKLNGLFVYRLLANPYDPSAFDQENLVTEATKDLMDAAGMVFTVTTPLKIFEFLINQHLDDLETRREFHQNRLLAMLDSSNEFTAEEKSLIRSSVFYSRLWIVNPFARDAARKKWATYGETQLAKITKKCSGFVGKGDKGYGACFKVDGHELRNKMIDANIISKQASLAYDFDKPTKVRNIRIALLLAKFGLTFVPVPGWVKTPVGMWISSQYSDQRRAEGWLWQSATDKGEDALAKYIVIDNLNPSLGL